jgi:hypothetical protein
MSIGDVLLCDVTEKLRARQCLIPAKPSCSRGCCSNLAPSACGEPRSPGRENGIEIHREIAIRGVIVAVQYLLSLVNDPLCIRGGLPWDPFLMC